MKVGKSLSKGEAVKSGVPQGSVLGPILFLVLMIDINKSVSNASVGSFADDTRLWHSIKNQLNVDELQADLHAVYGWANDYNMFFNQLKFERVHYGKNPEQANYTTPNGDVIQTKTAVRDLGVVFDSELMFHQHIVRSVAKARQMMGWALRAIRSRSKRVMLTLLNTLIIPHLEYASVVWSPIDMKHINLIENVQKSLTSKISCFQEYDQQLDSTVCTTDYPQRIASLKRYSLQRRRERYMILYLYKVIIGLVPNPGITYTFNDRTLLKINVKQATGPNWLRKARASTLFTQGAKIFNSLPRQLRTFNEVADTDSKKLSIYKRKLDNHLVTIPDRPGDRFNSLADM